MLKIIYDLIDAKINEYQKEIDALESARDTLKDLERDDEIGDSLRYSK